MYKPCARPGAEAGPGASLSPQMLEWGMGGQPLSHGMFFATSPIRDPLSPGAAPPAPKAVWGAGRVSGDG